MATTAGISIEQYLRTSYTPDCEYIDGELNEKPIVGLPHGELQALLSQWFGNHRKEWGIRVAVETRTHVEKTKYRLPDLVVIDQSERSKSTLEAPPLIAIEVLSPDDSYRDLRQRARELHTMGTANVWLIDPDEKSIAVWDGATWQPFVGENLQAAGTQAYLDPAWLWAEFA